MAGAEAGGEEEEEEAEAKEEEEAKEAAEEEEAEEGRGAGGTMMASGAPVDTQGSTATTGKNHCKDHLCSPPTIHTGAGRYGPIGHLFISNHTHHDIACFPV